MLEDEKREAGTSGVPAAPAALTVGIVGAGFMGHTHALAARAAGARIGGVVASSPSRIRDALRAVGAERGFSDLDELLSTPAIEVVHICLPNQLHFDAALAAIRAGKHVICEKPLAVTGTQAQILADAAAVADVVAAVPFVYRFHPMVREMRARIADGEAGKIGLLHGSYLQDWLADSDYNWRVDPAAGGRSRTFADIGSHWFDLLEFVTGDRAVAISAQFSTVRPVRRLPDGREIAVTTEDAVTVQFRTASGVLGSFSGAQVAAGRKNRLLLEASGTATSYAFDQENPEYLWAGDRSGHRVLVRDPSTLRPPAREYAVLPSGHAQGYQDCFNAFVSDVYRVIRGDRRDGLPDFGSGLRSARIVDAVVASAADDGRWIDLEERTVTTGQAA